MKILRIIDSRHILSEYSLDLQEGEYLSFGRSDVCDITLPEEGNLSRVHCHIYGRGGRIFIRDNASVNGVLCQGVAIVEAEMHPGQVFVLGLCSLTLEEYPDAPAPEVLQLSAEPASEGRGEPGVEGSGESAESPLPTPAPVVLAEVVIPKVCVEPTSSPEAGSAHVVLPGGPALLPRRSEPLPVSAVPVREPLPPSAAVVPLREPLPVSAGSMFPADSPSVGEAAPPSLGTPVHVRVQKRRLVVSEARPRRLIHAAAPAPRAKKQYTPRSIRTAVPQSAVKKKKRRLSIKEERWMNGADMPQSTSGAALGLPVDFGVQLQALVPRYPMQAEDMMALTVAAEEKCYVAVIQYDASGVPALIIPGSKRDNTAVLPHVLTRFPKTADADYELVVEAPFGPVRLVLLACTHPCKWASAYAKALETVGPAPYPGKLEAAIVASLPPSDATPRWSSSMLLLQTIE